MIKSIIQTLHTELSGKSEMLEYQELKAKRLDICKLCPLYKADTLFGFNIYKCDDKSYVEHDIKVVNADNQLIDSKERIYGCGCTLDNNGSILPEKTVLVGNETCPRQLWNKIEFDSFYIKELTQQYLKTTSTITKESILANIESLGIVNYCKVNNFTLALKPNINYLQTLSGLDIVTDSIFNIVALKRSNDEIEYITYKDLSFI